MKATLLLFAVLLSPTSLWAQQLPEWYRVYTFDESTIDMNTSKVLLGGDIGRVKFRWTFDQPEALRGNPQLKYKSRLEEIEFNCSEKRYRLYEVTYLNAVGKIIGSEEMSPPYKWLLIRSGSVIGDMFGPACELIESKIRKLMGTEGNSDAEIEMDKAAKYALSFSQSLEQAKDFKPIIGKFFAASYLDGYLHDDDKSWLLNLDRDTAAMVTKAELQRFYVASMNAGYLSCLYVISQYPSSSEPIQHEKLIPADIVQLIKNHPYTATYKHDTGNFDYLAEHIDSVGRLRSYTDLLERVSALMRKHVTSVGAEHSREYRAMLEDWGWTFDLYKPKVRICATECFGLPKGTKLFQVNVPVFRLQLAEISGQLKIVSAVDSFQ